MRKGVSCPLSVIRNEADAEHVLIYGGHALNLYPSLFRVVLFESKQPPMSSFQRTSRCLRLGEDNERTFCSPKMKAINFNPNPGITHTPIPVKKADICKEIPPVSRNRFL
jgi:hypothetical protein